MILPGRDVPWRDFARALLRKVLDDNLFDYAGSIAFSAILSVFPFLLLAVALAGMIIHPSTLETVLEAIRRAVPAQAEELVRDRLTALVSGPRPGLVTVSAVVALWTASGAVSALITAFDVAYGVRDRRPFWRTRGLALVVTIAASVFLIVAAILALGAGAIAAILPGPLGEALLWLRWPVVAILMALILGVLYHVLPDGDRDFHLVTLGSVVATVTWILASLGFSFYASRFGSYEVVYGALGGVIVLLMWFWISALAVLLGAEINAVLEGGAGAPTPGSGQAPV
jgi:membrane protein